LSGRTLVIGSGGGGQNTVSRIPSALGIPVVTINTGDHGSTIKMADGSVQGCRGDQDLGWALAYDYKEEICGAISGYHNIIVTAGLGGGTGSGTIPIIEECAKASGAKMISVVSIPMPFEASRRETALRQMQRIIQISDRTILFDIGKMPSRGGGPLPINKAISMADDMLKEAIVRICEMLEGPFFSTLSEKVYTISYRSSKDPVRASISAMDEYLFDADPRYGKIIVTSGTRMTRADSDAISEAIGNMTGIIPEVVQGKKEGDDHGILLFIPISYRFLLSSKHPRISP
jgi:cell division protein FtsZ